MGETARLLYNGLLDLNQKPLPPRRRIQMMELIRNNAQPVLNHLSHQLSPRTLPLSPRGQKVLRLLLRLQKELATGFRLALTDAMHEEPIGDKYLAIATHRALMHMGMIHLQAAKLYEMEPRGMWQEIHWLYSFAEKHHLTTSLVKDPTYHRLRQSSIREVYLQILLLALAIPSTLHQGEAERLSRFFKKNATLAIIEAVPLGFANNGVYQVNLKLDQPPTYTTELSKSLNDLRNLELGHLLTHLQEQLRRGVSRPDGIMSGNTLPADLTRRLLLKLCSHSKREFARSERLERIYVAIGLEAIHRAIQADKERIGFRDNTTPYGNGHAKSDLPQQPHSDPNFPHHNHDLRNYYDPNATHDDIWRLVDNDALWDTPSSSSGDLRNAHINSGRLDNMTPQEWDEWQLQDVSPGGFCISWKQDGSARALVGEVIALREQEGFNSIWRIGIIRWLRHITDQGLYAGVQLIAARSHLITAQHTKTRQKTKTFAIDGLLLPENQALHQLDSIILPATHFQTGDEVIIKEGANENQVRLMDCLQYSTRFSQFLIRTMDTSPHIFQS